ncbi:Glucagon receptor [Collichthys lucidus]|uniref:Glucagon receptor n=1 Tax=Collichthys lucidus TaxID=240159 RepID=A0A4U5VTL1_COLLU|nr:Glucagon receptor [Collichthys lucidus]
MSRLFLHLAVLIVYCSIQASLAVSLKRLKESWTSYMTECENNITRDPPSIGLVCNRTFDNYVCWPDGFPNTTVSVSCPWYLPWYHKVKHGMVYQECDANGQWVTPQNTSECDSSMQHLLQSYYGHIWVMYTVGYSLSLAALVLALGILIYFRKLHCMRNNIHMNLFASFILRALCILIKDAVLGASNITSQDLGRDQEEGFPQASMQPVELLVNNEMIGCRIAVVMMQYSIMANSYWLLVEGIYLHNLLVITGFTERNYFKIYLCIGWGVPLSQINFVIFIHIIKILVSKLRAHQMGYTDYKFRLAKSTLTLISLLGIHQMVTIFVIDESTETTIGLRLTRLFTDLFFSSFQVQSEILKKWKRWKLGRNIEEEYRHTYSNTPISKTGSLLLPQLPRLPDVAKSSAPDCTPEERHMLVTGCRNGMVLSKEADQCASPLHEGTDINLSDKVQCYEGQRSALSTA